MKKDFRYDAALLSRASFPAVLEADDRPCIVETTVYRLNAVAVTSLMLDGYYCGHFGEDMNALEIAAGIRWHYENGYNLLSDSTAIPDNPETEPAEPEETMELTLTIGPDQAKAIAQEVVKTVQPAIDYAAKKGAGVYRLGCSGSRGVCENRGRVAEQIHGRHALLSKHPPEMVAPI